MTELLTAAQMRAIEQAAIESGEVTGLELMERAGQGVVEAIFEEWPELDLDGGEGGVAPSKYEEGGFAPRPTDSPQSISGKMKRAVVLCGPGNNGGDGFVVARLLHERGWAVEVFLYGEAEKLPPDARVNYERWATIGKVGTISTDCLSKCEQPDLIIDAIFGTGLTRPLPEEIVNVLRWLLQYRAPWKPSKTRKRRVISEKMVSVDVPSGLCADTGKVLGLPDEMDFDAKESEYAWPRDMARCINADLTVTFQCAKIGHHSWVGGSRSGKLCVKDIGLERFAFERSFGIGTRELSERVGLLEPVLNGRPRSLELFVAQFLRKSGWHKFGYGHALILSGGPAQTGAARLAARGALRVGAGLVTLGVPGAAQMEVASQVTAIMLKRVGEADDLSAVLADERINAMCLGPALGLDRAKALVAAALAAKRNTVLDADALSAFADDPSALFAMLHPNCVLTPHGGEFARLFPDIAEKLNAVPTKGPAYSKVDATREAAARAGCVVLFKGPDTVIAAPDGRCSINSAHYEREAPWLATAGSGDVLAGFITGLMARAFEPMQAAEAGAWLHVECALEFGPGLIAEDIPEQLPAVFRKLGL